MLCECGDKKYIKFLRIWHIRYNFKYILCAHLSFDGVNWLQMVNSKNRFFSVKKSMLSNFFIEMFQYDGTRLFITDGTFSDLWSLKFLNRLPTLSINSKWNNKNYYLKKERFQQYCGMAHALKRACDKRYNYKSFLLFVDFIFTRHCFVTTEKKNFFCLGKINASPLAGLVDGIHLYYSNTFYKAIITTI